MSAGALSPTPVVALRLRTGFILESATWRASADWGAKLGYSREALEHAKHALALRRASKDAYGEAHLLHAVGLVEMEQGRFGDALRNFTRSHLIFRRLAVSWTSS